MNMQEKIVIGRTSEASFVDDDIVNVPVKIDTGADSSAVWASGIEIDQSGVLSFRLFDKSSPHYTGKVHRHTDFSVKLVRSSHGHTQIRYAVKLSVKLDGRKVRATFTLADRSQNTYPVLVGCRLLKGRFLIDVSLGEMIPSRSEVYGLKEELKRDPRAFYEKYHIDNERGDIVL